MPNGLIDDSSLRTHPDGLALALTLPWYRSLWLSSVSDAAPHASTASRWMPRTSRSSSTACATRSTSCPSRATCSGTCRRTRCSSSTRPQPVALGETHEVEVFGELRLPYMQIAPGADGGPGMYVPNVVRQALTLTVTDRDAAAPALVGDVPRAAGGHRGATRSSSASRSTRRAPSSAPAGSTSRGCSTGSPSSASDRASRSSPRRCCRRTRSCPTSSCARGARRSTGTGSTRARSARTSTWAAAATAT